MNKKIFLLFILIILIATGAYFGFVSPNKSSLSNNLPSGDALNATYVIDGQSVTLVNGKSEAEAAPGSASVVISSVFGEPISGDLNNDGKNDLAMIISVDQGGSGTFYYATALIDTGFGPMGTNAIFLGDRIAPQPLEIKDNKIIANFADRAPEEDMSETPSVGVTKYITFNGSTLEVAPPVSSTGEHCGGNLANASVCATGLHCAPDPESQLPAGDVGGICVED